MHLSDIIPLGCLNLTGAVWQVVEVPQCCLAVRSITCQTGLRPDGCLRGYPTSSWSSINHGWSEHKKWWRFPIFVPFLPSGWVFWSQWLLLWCVVLVCFFIYIFLEAALQPRVLIPFLFVVRWDIARVLWWLEGVWRNFGDWVPDFSLGHLAIAVHP